jgi:hypothetical protein
LAGKAEAISAARRQPLVKQIVGQPLAQADLQHLLHPGLSHHQRQQDGNDGEEDQELAAEGEDIALGENIEEVAMPLVEPDLTHHVGGKYDNDTADEQADATTVSRAPRGAQQCQPFGGDALVLVGCSGGLEGARFGRPGEGR